MVNDDLPQEDKTAENAPETPPTDDVSPITEEALLFDARENEKQVLEEQINKFKDSFMRERAENENLRKRHERDLQNAYKFASEKLIKDLLPVLDSLVLGLEAAKNQSENNEGLAQFIAGSEMTLKLLRETLQKHGVEELDPVGEKLNPELHQALSIVPNTENEVNTILHVAQKGYVLNGRVIRAAQVIVAGE